ncbi:MAG: prolipoprotein diacylglyceryl transferase [Caldilineaceae bacterium]|nr:prolipoprotein diacylglyceryl transferase [Caldilineaceae bacterium]
MYPSLPLGPLSLPTAQILAIVAAWFGLSVMARVGRRLELDPDMIWNLGTIALAAGVIVARLSHAVQFWSVYRAEPLLLVSIRPGGLLLWPGLVGSLVAAYLYLIRAGVDPRPVGVAAVFGLLAGGVVLEISNFLTGAVVGTFGVSADALSWYLSLTGDSYDAVLSQSASIRHPVALYRAIGMMLIVGGSLAWGNWSSPGRLAGQAVLVFALLRLFADGFAADSRLLGSMRTSQVAALIAAAGLAFVLARTADGEGQLQAAKTGGEGFSPAEE